MDGTGVRSQRVAASSAGRHRHRARRQGPLGNILSAQAGTGSSRSCRWARRSPTSSLSVLLVARYGMLGVAIGTAVPVVLANLFILLPAACRQVAAAGLADFVRTVAVAPAIGAVVAALAGVALRSARRSDRLPAIVLEGAAVGVIYLIAVWLFRTRHRRPRALPGLRAVTRSSRFLDSCPHCHDDGRESRHDMSISVVIATYNRGGAARRVPAPPRRPALRARRRSRRRRQRIDRRHVACHRDVAAAIPRSRCTC